MPSPLVVSLSVEGGAKSLQYQVVLECDKVRKEILVDLSACSGVGTILYLGDETESFSRLLFLATPGRQLSICHCRGEDVSDVVFEMMVGLVMNVLMLRFQVDPISFPRKELLPEPVLSVA